MAHSSMSFHRYQSCMFLSNSIHKISLHPHPHIDHLALFLSLNLLLPPIFSKRHDVLKCLTSHDMPKQYCSSSSYSYVAVPILISRFQTTIVSYFSSPRYLHHSSQKPQSHCLQVLHNLSVNIPRSSAVVQQNMFDITIQYDLTDFK